MANAVTYAEKDLGVHKVFEEAQERLTVHAVYSAERQDCNSRIRQIKSDQADREAVVAAELRGQDPKASATAFKEMLKAALAADEETTHLREDLLAEESGRERAESEIHHHELGIRMLTARMEELAGLLHYYGAAKQAQTNKGEPSG